MTERILLLFFLAAACVAAYGVLKAWQGARLRRLARIDAPRPVIEVVGEAAGGAGPALLYFTTAECAQCRFQQRPILDRLADLSPIPVVTVDAIQREDLVRHFGVMTVPTTVVLDGNQRPVAINHGVAPLQKLHAQVAAVRA